MSSHCVCMSVKYLVSCIPQLVCVVVSDLYCVTNRVLDMLQPSPVDVSSVIDYAHVMSIIETSAALTPALFQLREALSVNLSSKI